MILLCIIFIILSISLAIFGISSLEKANRIIIQKNREEEEIEIQIQLATQKIESLTEKIKISEEQYNKNKKDYEEKISIYEKNLNYAEEKYTQELAAKRAILEEKHNQEIQELENQKKEYYNEIDKLKESLNAGVQAQLREREKQESLNFYKLNISNEIWSDIETLDKIKYSLRQPVLINKLIWTSYFQKQTTELCNRIVGTQKKCGIYKITNIKTQQCYIGQSVDIATRWKDHIKCGLGIDASATNKLYNAMQQDGVWNFTFEIIEECPREQLNEKEKFWIELYQSNLYGYNLTKGNK